MIGAFLKERKRGQVLSFTLWPINKYLEPKIRWRSTRVSMNGASGRRTVESGGRAAPIAALSGFGVENPCVWVTPRAKNLLIFSKTSIVLRRAVRPPACVELTRGLVSWSTTNNINRIPSTRNPGGCEKACCILYEGC